MENTVLQWAFKLICTTLQLEAETWHLKGCTLKVKEAAYF
jgi:hypothetical protein